MKLGKKNLMLVSFMLFSLFFGAGNLIFPPFLGQMAGKNAPVAMLGFLVTAVVLPVMGVVAVAKYNGLEQLARKVNPVFAMVFTIAIYLSIGPGLGIPRAASVPFEMAISPLLPEGASFKWGMLVYSLIFFAVAGWLALAPNKLVDRIGKFLSPCLLTLLVVLFVGFLFKGKMDVAPATGAYQNSALVTGFLEGYNTMDAIAALNFGLVIAVTLRQLNVENKKDVMGYTVKAGVLAGTILTLIYVGLSFIGMQSSKVYAPQANGALILRNVVNQVFGTPGAVFLAVIFTLACLTTCVGLITSISQYFATLTPKFSQKKWAVVITVFSFAVCNQGLNTILSLSVPVLNAVYPIAIVLIVMALTDKLYKNNKFAYPVTVLATTVISLLHALDSAGVPFGAFGKLLHKLPFYGVGMGWVTVSVVFFVLSMLLGLAFKNKKTQKEEK